jgi:hypothetical protein
VHSAGSAHEKGLQIASWLTSTQASSAPQSLESSQASPVPPWPTGAHSVITLEPEGLT